MNKVFSIIILLTIILSACSTKGYNAKKTKEEQAREYFVRNKKAVAKIMDNEEKNIQYQSLLLNTFLKFKETKLADTCITAYLESSSTAQIGFLIQVRDIDKDAYPLLKDLIKRKEAEEIAHKGTRYFDASGTLFAAGRTTKATLQELIGKNGKSTLLYFCDLRDNKTLSELKKYSSVDTLNANCNILIMPLGNTAKDVALYINKVGSVLPVFLESGKQRIIKYGYGIYTIPSTILLDDNGTIVERNKNASSITMQI